MSEFRWKKAADELPPKHTTVLVRLKNNGWQGRPTYALAEYSTYGWDVADEGIELYAADDTSLGCQLDSEVTEWTMFPDCKREGEDDG